MEKLTKLYSELYETGATLIDRALKFDSEAKSAVLCAAGVYGILLTLSE